MAKKQTRNTIEVDPALLGYIEETVTAKVAEQMAQTKTNNRANIIVFSSDFDKLMAAFVIATGAASMGMEVSMYFAFWGLAALKKKTILKNKSITEKLMALMLPQGPDNIATSKMNMLGIGPAFFRYVMKKKNISTLPELIKLARELEVRMVACQMSMDVMGLKKEELLDGLDYGGVFTYLTDAKDSKITLFI